MDFFEGYLVFSGTITMVGLGILIWILRHSISRLYSKLNEVRKGESDEP